MLNIEFTSQFKRDYKLCKKRGLNIDKLKDVITLLSSESRLPQYLKDHQLLKTNKFSDYRECHIAPDWLLIYKKYQNNKKLRLIRTGTHSDLFDK